MPVKRVTEQAKAGCAPIIIGQGGFESVDVHSVRSFSDFGNSRFVDPPQPLVLRDLLLTCIHIGTVAGGDIALLVCPGNCRIFLCGSFAEKLPGEKTLTIFSRDRVSKLPIIRFAVHKPQPKNACAWGVIRGRFRLDIVGPWFFLFKFCVPTRLGSKTTWRK